MQVIYRLTSPSGRVYIGQTKRFASRMSAYRTMHKSSQRMLHASLKKYGFEAHVVQILHRFPYTVSQEIVDDYEKYAIAMHKVTMRCSMLNLTDGGRGCGNKGPQPRRVDRPDVRGEKSKKAKLTEADVRDIRAVYQKGKRWCGLRLLARRYNVSPRLIYNVVNRKSWLHLPDIGNKPDLWTLQLEADIKQDAIDSQKRKRPVKEERPQCSAMKSEAIYVRCTNRSLPSRDVCGRHSPEFREATRRRTLEQNAARARGASGRWVSN